MDRFLLCLSIGKNDNCSHHSRGKTKIVFRDSTSTKKSAYATNFHVCIVLWFWALGLILPCIACSILRLTLLTLITQSEKTKSSCRIGEDFDCSIWNSRKLQTLNSILVGEDTTTKFKLWKWWMKNKEERELLFKNKRDGDKWVEKRMKNKCMG